MEKTIKNRRHGICRQQRWQLQQNFPGHFCCYEFPLLATSNTKYTDDCCFFQFNFGFIVILCIFYTRVTNQACIHIKPCLSLCSCLCPHKKCHLWEGGWRLVKFTTINMTSALSPRTRGSAIAMNAAPSSWVRVHYYVLCVRAIKIRRKTIKIITL